MNLVLDYSWGRPDPAWMKRAGVVGVLRYLRTGSDDTGRGLTSAELAALHEAGLAVGCIWQESGTFMTKGAEAGRTGGRRAREEMERLGAPGGSAVYFAADSEKVTAAQASAYLDAARLALDPYAIGLYGSHSVITETQKSLGGDAAYWWQTAAWSSDGIAKRIHLYQGLHRGNFGGEQVDGNTLYVDNWGQFEKTV